MEKLRASKDDEIKRIETAMEQQRVSYEKRINELDIQLKSKLFSIITI